MGANQSKEQQGTMSSARTPPTLTNPNVTRTDDEGLSKRPIPPPLSREGVLRQFGDVTATGVDNVGHGEEIVLVASRKRPLDEVMGESAAEEVSDGITAGNPAREASVSVSAIKKRRLRLPLHAHTTADETAHRATEAGSAHDGKHTVSTAFEDAEVDEGYCTGSLPNSPCQLEDNVDDDVAAQELARMHNLITRGLSRSPELEGENEWISMSGRKVAARSAADERHQAEKEDQYALRSKQLREERLRQFCEVEDPFVGDTVANGASESIEAPAQSFLEATLSSIGEPQTDLAPDEWCADTESLGDQTDSDTPGDENFEWYESPTKAGIARSQSRALLNPASRQAAERYRTQGRHLETGSIDHVVPARRPVNEDSLLAAKAGHRVPISQGGHQARIESVPVQFSRPSDSRVARDSGGKFVSQTQTLSPAARALAAKWKKQTAEASLGVPVGEVASDVDRSDETIMRNERARLKSLGTVVNNLNLAWIHLSLIRLSGKLFAEREQEMHRKLLKLSIDLMKKGAHHETVQKEISGIKDQSRRALPGEMMSYKSSKVNEVYEEADVKVHYHELCGPEHAEQIQTALRKIPASMATIDEWLEALYRQGVEERARKRAMKRAGGDKTRVRFASSDEMLDSDGIARSVRAQQPKAKKFSRTQLVINKLAWFKDAAKEREAQMQSQEQQPPGSVAQHQDSSEESEEDADGEGYFGAAQRSPSGFGSQLPPGFARPQALEIEQEQGTPEALEMAEVEPAEGAQRALGQDFDERLAYENKITALDRRTDSISDEEDLDDLDSSASVSDSDSLNDGHQQAYKYSIHGIFRGVQGFDDDDEYLFSSFLQIKNAETKITDIVKDIQRQYQGECGHDYELSTTIRGSVTVSQSLEMSNGFFAKVWMSKTVIDLTKRQAKKARNIVPQHVGHQWIVHWQKDITTTTTTTITRLAQSSRDLAEDMPEKSNDDSLAALFEATPPPTTPGSSSNSSASTPRAANTITDTKTDVEHTTHYPKPEEQDFYTNSYHANVRAKEIYIDWYASFCPDHERPTDKYPEYSGMLGQVEAAMRAELEGVADIPGAIAGPWEEEFERPEEETVEDEQKPGVIKVVKKVKVKERMVVRVVQNSVKGPRN
jgi:hypothetical protein